MNVANVKANIGLRFTRIRTLLQSFVGWTGNPEQEQAAIRIAILSAVLAYLLANKPVSHEHQLLWLSGVKFISVLLPLSFAIYGSTIIWSGESHARKIVGILVDSVGQSYALYLTGPIGAPWYGLYLWFVLGNGFRYGEKYIYLATAIALTGFSFVAIFTPYWVANSELAIGLACTLLLIPAYSAILIRRLNEARQRADAASRAKSDFLSCMSHEIRTPLNGILGMTDLLRLRPLSGEDKDCVETIHVSAHALARQINEILDLSKIEAGRMSIETIEFDLYVLVNATLRMFKKQCQDKGLELNSTINPITPYLLSGDPYKLRQIITNLVGNALKFTHTGAITLHITPVSTEENNTLLRFEVTDTGTGIPQDKLKVIFDPFTQASDSISRNYGGTGLGTTICKNLVELMGGTIGVESTLDIGSTFWFQIPFIIDANQTKTQIKKWASGCRVIYVSPEIHEDNTILKQLEDWGVQFDIYTSIEEARKNAISLEIYDAMIINEQPFDPLRCNIVDGTARNLSKNLPVVLINSDNQRHSCHNKCESHFILDTPIQDNLLLNILHACYSKHVTEDEMINVKHKHSHAKSFGRQLNVLVSDDNAINRIVMQRMLDKLGHRHTIVNGGEAAILALENDQFDAVIIDKNMPEMGGVDVYQAYCFAHGGVAPVEFAILTADATEEAKESCAAIGIKHFLTKPVSLIRLTEVLSDMCGSISDTRNPPEIVIETKARNLVPAAFFDDAEFDNLAELSGGDVCFIRQVVDNFTNDTKIILQDLEAAVANGDWFSFRDLAHALKGSSRYLGLTQMAELAKDAQNISEQDFRDKGISNVLAIRKAADIAFSLLQAKLAENPANRAAG